MDKRALLILYVLLCSCSTTCVPKIKPVTIPQELITKNNSNILIDGLELDIGCKI